MKLTKLFILCGMVFITCSLSAQNDKGNKKNLEQIEEMNTLISSVDKTLALSEDQKTKINQLFNKRNDEIKAIKDGTGTEVEKEDKIKLVRKNINTTLNTEILTKEQKKAKEAAKKVIKEK
jgi:hypothetical protein